MRNINIEARIGQIATDQGSATAPARPRAKSAATATRSAARARKETGRRAIPMRPRPIATRVAAFAGPSTITTLASERATKKGSRSAIGRSACTAKPAKASIAIRIEAVFSTWKRRMTTRRMPSWSRMAA
jgi:hypothetical protein